MEPTPTGLRHPNTADLAIQHPAMAITPFTLLVCLSLLFAVAALIPGWNGHVLVCVAVVLLAVAQFLR